MPSSQVIRCKPKNNHGLVARVFPLLKVRTTKRRKREQQSSDKKLIDWKRLSNTGKYLTPSYVTHRWLFNHLALPLSHKYSTALNYCTWASCWYCDLISSPVPISGKKNDLFNTCEKKANYQQKNSCFNSLWGERDINPKLNKIQWILWT